MLSDPTMPDFEQALDRARAGDDDALSALLERYGPAARASLQISPVWQAHIDSDDVMQVTYLEAFLRIGSFAGTREGVFLAWLAQLAQNNLRDAIRALEAEKRPSPRRRVECGDSNSYAKLCELVGVTTSTPSRAASNAEIQQLVDEAIKRLPQDYAEVIRLLDLQDFSGPEVAERMGRSRAAVYMLAGRAHDRLRELLGAQSQFFSC